MRLISAAVVDGAGRLVGMITVDDVVHIIQEEASEDVLLLSGAGEEGDINEPVGESYRARVRWLIANLLTALVAAFVIRQFEDSIERLAILAVLMPIVAGVGGNAGTQTLAVTVRAHRHQPADRLQPLARGRPRNARRDAQRPDHRGADRGRRHAGARQRGARRGDRRGDADQHHRRRARRGAGPADARARPAPTRRWRQQRVRHHGHRFDGLPAFLGLATASGLVP